MSSFPEDEADESDSRIETPGSPDALYLTRTDTDPYRPIMAGDVFRGSLGSPHIEHELVAVVSHPCSMRAGASLRPLVQVAPVVPRGPVTSATWSGEFRWMLLPELLETDQAYAASFEHAAPMSSGELILLDRVACLSEYGILISFQRHVRHLTRFELGVRDLEPVTRAILTELQLNDDWNQSLARPRVEHGEEIEAVLAEEATAFEQFMSDTRGEDGATLRTQLREHFRHPDVRRVVALEIQRRLP